MRKVSKEVKFETVEYRGKHFSLPLLSSDGVRFEPRAQLRCRNLLQDSPVIQDLNKPFDLQCFKTPRRPVSVGFLSQRERRILSRETGAPRVLDMPIKFPGSDVRIPAELAMYEPIIPSGFCFRSMGQRRML